MSNFTQKKQNRNILWLLSLLLILPFIMATRFPPYLSFNQDIVVVVTILALFLVTLSINRLYTNIPRVSILFFILAAYWFIQPLWINLPYPSENIRIGLLFILMSMLGFCVQSLLLEYGREKIVAWVAWSILLGVLFQGFTIIIQFANLTEYVPFLQQSSNRGVEGQLGQRNNLAHYLMWGLLLSCYITGKSFVRPLIGGTIIVLVCVLLMFANSRSLIAYCLIIFIFLFVVRLICGKSKDFVPKTIFISVFMMLTIQWAGPILLDFLGFEMTSGLGRLVEKPEDNLRLSEWKKAWFSISESPLLGYGWNGSTYQSVMKDIDIIPDTTRRTIGFFSHSHNIVLELLVEMGALGFVIVSGGLLWVVWPSLKSLKSSEFKLVFCVLSVTACHSMLEYPLWYTYFLAVSVVFLAIMQPINNNNMVLGGLNRTFLQLLSFSSLLIMIFVFVLYQWFILQKIKETKGVVALSTVRIDAMYKLANTVPLLPFYRDLQLLKDIKPADAPFSVKDAQVLERFSLSTPAFRPAHLHGLSLYIQGKQDDSLNWMKKIWHHYPQRIPYAMEKIYAASPKFEKLEDEVYRVCLRQKELKLYEGLFENCEKPPHKTTEIKK